MENLVQEDFFNLDDYTKKIQRACTDIMKSYLYIGFLLNEVNQYKVYSKKYSSLIEYADKELGFKKSTVYNCIAVLKRFAFKDERGNYKMFLKDEYKEYNFSQLVQLTKLEDEEIKVLSVTKDTPVKEIKEKIKQNSTRVENKSVEPVEVEYIEINSSNYSLTCDEVKMLKVLFERNKGARRLQLQAQNIDTRIFDDFLEKLENYNDEVIRREG